MGIGVGIHLIAVGAILTFAVLALFAPRRRRVVTTAPGYAAPGYVATPGVARTTTTTHDEVY